MSAKGAKSPLRVRIIGRGRVGRGLFGALSEGADEGLTLSLEGARRLLTQRPPGQPNAGQLIEATETLDGPQKESREAVIVAVPDAQIETVARSILAQAQPGAQPEVPVILHCAGARGIEAFGSLVGSQRNVSFGAMHPLVSFADPEHPPPLAGTCFAIAGDSRARPVATRIARACGATPIGRGTAGVHGAAYHAAAALVANGAAGLAFVGVSVLRELGLSKRASEKALGTLLRSVAHNIETLGVPKALTGPVMRGDRETIAWHRQALGQATDARRTYDALVPVIERCAAALQRKRK